mmetsp:Transcript_7150/g.22084  ORF Transcript_7150/g.22084 Transcript_7150/m.22084 type:complete len:210 (-) Transcript_7150:933-1562(-)
MRMSSCSKERFSCSSSATFFIFSIICSRAYCSRRSARPCASRPSSIASRLASPADVEALLAASSAIWRFLSSSAFISSAISLSASRRSSRNASLFSMIALACTSGIISLSFSRCSASNLLSSSFSDARSLISCICSWITAFISACSFSTALAFASMVIDRQDWPKRRHAVDSWTCSAELESARMMWSMLLPPRPFWSIIVSFDSRKGIC